LKRFGWKENFKISFPLHSAQQKVGKRLFPAPFHLNEKDWKNEKRKEIAEFSGVYPISFGRRGSHCRENKYDPKVECYLFHFVNSQVYLSEFA